MPATKPPEIYYNSNCTPDGNHSWGPPEIIMPYPEGQLTLADLYERAEIALNEHSDLVEDLLQQLCQEGYPEIDVVEQDAEGEFIISADEVIYCGCQDYDLRSNLTVRLTHRFAPDGIHFFLFEDALRFFHPWYGDAPDLEEEEEEDEKEELQEPKP